MAKGKGQAPAGNTTTTNTTTPWSGQIPYLEQAFGAAQNLFGSGGPQYYPGSTYAGETAGQSQGLQDIYNETNAANWEGNTANNYLGSLLGGNYLNSNPANGTLEAIDTGAYSSPWDLQGYGTINSYANGTKPLAGQNTLTSYAGGYSPLAGEGTLGAFSSGAFMSNPAQQALANSVASQIVPNISAAFANGNSGNNPAVAYAAGQGVASGLAPTEYSNYQTQEQLAQNAAQTLGGENLAQQGQQIGAATTLGGQSLAQQQQQLGAATQLSNEQLQGLGLQEQSASNLGSLYNQGVQEMNAGLAMAPQTQNMLYTGADQLYNAGAQQQALNQGQLNSNVANWNYNQELPYNNLATYLGDISGNFGGTSATSSPYFENKAGQGLSGAMGGAGLGKALGGAFPQTIGSGMGAGLGSLFGLLLSDRRAKTDIEPIALVMNGLTLYSFRYIGDNEPQVGFMADEVEQIHPEAVYLHPSGLKMVNYDLAVA